MNETEEFLLEKYNSILKEALEKGELQKEMYDHLSAKPLNTLEELDQAYSELIYFLKNSDFFKLLERIAKGEAMRDAETDKDKKEYFIKILESLYKELDKHMPEGEAA